MADSIVEYETVTLYGRSFQNVPLIEPSPTSWSYNPVKAETSTVWALPRSLAATKRISFDYFSSGYLDVSVPQVPSSYSLVWVTELHSAGFPHSDIYGSMVACTSP